VTDLGAGAVSGIKLVAAAEQGVELGFEGLELLLSGVDIVQLGGEQRADVGAGGVAVVAELEDGGDLGEGEPCPLAAADELQSGDRRGVVDPVAVGAAPQRG